MKTLIYGAGPIGQWLALKLALAGKDVTLLARNETYRTLERDGVRMVDGLTGEKLDFRGEFYQHTLMTPFFTPTPESFCASTVVGTRM